VKRFSFCPVCGAKLDDQPAGPDPVNVLVCPECRFNFWQNSKPAVGVILLRAIGGKRHVLLTRRGIEPYKGFWDLPGGFLANGELPVDGILREIREELGVSVVNPSFFTVEMDQYNREDIAEQARFVLTLYYECTAAPDATFVPADDVVEATWFPLDKLPANLAFGCNRRALAKLSASRGAG